MQFLWQKTTKMHKNNNNIRIKSNRLSSVVCGVVSCITATFCPLPLQQTLRRKGLGLEGAEVDSEESVQAAAAAAAANAAAAAASVVDKYPLGEGMDLSVSRQRYFVSQKRTSAKKWPNAEHFINNCTNYIK